MADSTDTLEKIAAKATQNGKPRKATFADLTRKPRRKIEFTITTADENGGTIEVGMRFKALNPDEYDEVVAAHPPKPADKQKGAVFNIDTFAPALISAVSDDPPLSYEEAAEIYKSKEWSSGEITSLFLYAQRVCNSGLDIPFNDRG
jgi:hypothetical protein